jgi:integrase
MPPPPPTRCSARGPQHEITPLTAAEAQRLIEATEGDRMQARWLVGLALGLRQGEALGLWWDDVDLDTRLLRVRRALHDLRHTAASLLLAQNVPARVVMEILGHSQIALTMNTHSHVAPEVSREAADRMARMLWQDSDDGPDDGE